jgi:hypothetical protein
MNKNKLMPYKILFLVRHLFVIFILLFWSSISFSAQLHKLTINDNFLLLDTYLDKDQVSSSIDAYSIDGKLLLAVQPLFDVLTLRNSITSKELNVWKENTLYSFELVDKAKVNADGFWIDDGYYLFIDSETLSNLFNVEISYSKSNLKLHITTSDYKFPKQQLAKLSLQRLLSRNGNKANYSDLLNEDIIEDEYRLFTLPHGSFSTNLNSDSDDNTSLNYSLQTVSDFLYHSTNITITDTNKQDLTGSVRFSRYKTKPNEMIFGAFDRYSFGDVSATGRNLTTSTRSGLGVVFSRAPETYRNRNVGITLEETAIPGWSAELYRNGQFIELKVVPADGNLIFDDVETQYGNNRYEIKLYGPFGEENIITRYYNIDSNALSAGQMAYSFYGVDHNKRIINDQSESGFSITDSGFTFDYGISDSWLLGLSAIQSTTNVNDKKQSFVTLKNAFVLPGYLFENEVSAQNEAGYSQISTLTGNAYGRDTFSVIYQSADDFKSNRINSADSRWHNIYANYAGFLPSLGSLGYGIGVGYNTIKDDVSIDDTLGKEDNHWQFNQRLSKSFGGVSVTNTLYYNRYEQLEFETITEEDKINNARVLLENWSGNLGLGGSLTNNVRLNAGIQYKPDNDRDIIQSGNITLSWFNSRFYHSLRGIYYLADTNNKWQLGYNMSWNNRYFSSNLSSTYNAEDEWTIGLGFNLFFGYDYHNKTMRISNDISSGSASINTYSYLDRNPNGWRDESDWDLEGVSFTGNSAWKDIKSGENGRVVVPGVSTNTPFQFNASWEYGTSTLQKDYVLYTHPGAYVDVNIPFYITTDISGFVYVTNSENEDRPLAGAILYIQNNFGEIIKEVNTDQDGFYEARSLKPGRYQVAILPEYLDKSGFTANNVGFEFTTSSKGGFVELDDIKLTLSDNNGQRKTQTLQLLRLNANNSGQQVWLDEEDPLSRQIYSLPVRSNFQAQQRYSQPNKLPVTPKLRDYSAINPVQRNELPIKPIERAESIIKVQERAYLPEALSRTLESVKASELNENLTSLSVKASPQKSVNNNNNRALGFVIQLAAHNYRENALTAAKQLNSSIPLYIAEKEIKGVKKYCIISQTYVDYQTAKGRLANNNLTGWVTSNSAYSNIKKLND